LSSELLVASDGANLVAICSPRGGLGDPERETLQRAFGSRVEVAGCGEGSSPRCWVAGRIDDRSDLARELGLPPDADVDALVSAGWQRWSDGLFGRLRGQFTILAWDPARHATTVATDQLGTLSPHVHETAGRLYVATRFSLILRLLPGRPAPDRLSILQAFSGQTPPVHKTLVEGVERIAGGDRIVVDAGGVRTHAYWRPRYRRPEPLSVEDASELLWGALRQAVRRRLAGTEQAGIAMSGGVDSTAVAAAAVAEGARPPTYSSVFPGRSIDEAARIDAVAEALELPNVQVQLEPAGSLALFLDYLEATGTVVPGAGYLVERPLLEQAAADGTTALLDGQGGDELFGTAGFLIGDRVRRGRLLSSVQLTRRLPGAAHGTRRQLIRAWRLYGQDGAVPFAVQGPLMRRRALRDLDADDLLTVESQRLLIEPDETIGWKRQAAGPLWWRHQAWLLTRAREGVRVTDYLRERAALAGIEARPPLFDVDLIETVLRLPPETGFDPDLDRPLIRRATAGLVPDSVRLSTFKSNLAPFFLEATLRAQPQMRALLAEPQLALEPYVNVDALRKYLGDPPTGADDRERWRWSSALWNAVTVECWLRSLDDAGFIDRLRSELSPEPPVWSVHSRSV
jgi:asparagine synthase (glutamine-hydrolysing)